MKAIFNCSKCNEKNKLEVKETLDITNDDKTISTFYDNSYFIHKCSKCGEDNLVIFPLSVRDDKYKFYIKLDPSDEKIFLFLDRRDFNVRVVKNLNEFNEKIRIFRSYLEDNYIEIIKYLIKSDYEKNNKDLTIDEVYFKDINNGNLEFLVFDETNYLGIVKVSMSSYFSIEEEYKDLIDNVTQVVDRDYATYIIKEKENRNIA